VSPYLQLPVPSLSSSLPQAPKFPNCSFNLPDELSRNHTEGLIDEDEYIRENLVPILAMIEPKAPIDVQLEGIRILCDFSMSIDLHRLLVECHCVEKLIDLLTSKMAIGDADDRCVEETRCHQNALYAIANMSTFRPCQVPILFSPSTTPLTPSPEHSRVQRSIPRLSHESHHKRHPCHRRNEERVCTNSCQSLRRVSSEDCEEFRSSCDNEMGGDCRFPI
jgi:hypothetical protein